MVKGTIIGDARVLAKLLEDLRDAADESIRESIERLGFSIQKETRRTIITNSAGWTPLSARHLEYKKRNGYHSKIYLMTKSLYTSLNHEVTKKNGQHQVTVGFPRSLHPVTKVALSEIAKNMEEGDTTTNLPRRPLISHAAPIAISKFMKSKHTPDKIFAKKAKLLVSKASGSMSFSTT